VFPIIHDATTNAWRVLHRRTVERSGDTMDSGANLVFQAGDITGLDDLTFNGSGSVVSGAGGTISDFAVIQMRAGGLLDMDSGPITNVTDLSMVDASSVLSMLGGDITGVDDITMNGVGSVIDGSGSTIQNFGTLTMDGPGSVISDVDEFYLEDSGSVFDAADGTISDVGILEINDGVGRGLPSGEPVRVVGFNGNETACIGELAVLSNELNVNLPIYYSRVDNATSSTTFTPTIDFSDIHGLDFSGGVVRVKVTVQSFRNDATEVAYGPQDVSQSFTIMLNTGSNAKCYPRYIDNGATIYREYTNYFDDSYTITFTEVSSTEILFTGSLTGTGTRTAAMLIELEYGIVP
jgi:hypothetical protein